MTNKAIAMANSSKDVLEAKLHWYRSVLFFRIDLSLFTCLFRFILGFDLVQG